MSEGLDLLLSLLDLEQIDRDFYRGRNPPMGRGRVFGGQVAGQALRAASNSVAADHAVNSLHAYFLRPGRPGVPIVYSIDRIRNGSSFTTRRVVALQDGEAILNLDASFHKDEPGLEFELPAPVDKLVRPEELPPSAHGAGPGDPDRRPIDTRDLRVLPRPTSTRAMWVRANGVLPDDPALHACVLTYISDSGPVGAARRPLVGPGGSWGPRPSMMSASLDHTMWFHRPVKADGWLLYDLEAVACAGARGLTRGTMYTADGHLALTVNQESLLRPLA